MTMQRASSIQGAIATLVLDEPVTGYATFQSHNQKVVSNPWGIFLTYLVTRTADEHNIWRLVRSIDGGRSFETIYQSTDGTLAPVIETDALGRIYMVYSGMAGLDTDPATFMRFDPANGFTAPTVVRSFAGGAAGKYAMVLDWARQRLYYSAWGRRLFTLDLDGNVLAVQEVLVNGQHGSYQYPLLAMAENGDLYFAWTTEEINTPRAATSNYYWDIHVMASKDGATTWRRLDGSPLYLPVVADDTGPADRVSLNDEFGMQPWLAGMLAKSDKLHMNYYAYPPINRPHYVRYDLYTGDKDVDRDLGQGDGFFATDPVNPNSPLYYTGVRAPYGWGCLRSIDNGLTWDEYASDNEAVVQYALGGARALDEYGAVLGTYTALLGYGSGSPVRGSARFLKVSTPISVAVVQLTAVGISTDLASPQEPGAVVTWTAIPSPAEAEAEYKWWFKRPDSDWILWRGWSPITSFQWDTTILGTYYPDGIMLSFACWARPVGSTYDSPSAPNVSAVAAYTVAPSVGIQPCAPNWQKTRDGCSLGMAVEVWDDDCGHQELRNAHTQAGACGAPVTMIPPPTVGTPGSLTPVLVGAVVIGGLLVAAGRRG